MFAQLIFPAIFSNKGKFTIDTILMPETKRPPVPSIFKEGKDIFVKTGHRENTTVPALSKLGALTEVNAAPTGPKLPPTFFSKGKDILVIILALTKQLPPVNSSFGILIEVKAFTVPIEKIPTVPFSSGKESEVSEGRVLIFIDSAPSRSLNDRV
jgi:hypothetical protein